VIQLEDMAVSGAEVHQVAIGLRVVAEIFDGIAAEDLTAERATEKGRSGGPGFRSHDAGSGGSGDGWHER
jgi:hypothetical protein